MALGRSGAGKTTCCKQVLEHLVGMAGSVDGSVSGTVGSGGRGAGLWGGREDWAGVLGCSLYPLTSHSLSVGACPFDVGALCVHLLSCTEDPPVKAEGSAVSWRHWHQRAPVLLVCADLNALCRVQAELVRGGVGNVRRGTGASRERWCLSKADE